MLTASTDALATEFGTMMSRVDANDRAEFRRILTAIVASD